MSYIHYTTWEAPKTLEQMVACARKEWKSRQRVYPEWVEAGRMTQVESNHGIECMEAIFHTLFRLNELQQGSIDAERLEMMRQQKNER